jgi:hypothetical protein
VFEPRQHPDQEEKILDRFEMLPGAEPIEDYELRSGTAAYRFLPLGEETRQRLAEEEGRPERPEAQKNPYGIEPEAEMKAGSTRQQELEKQEQRRETADERDTPRREARRTSEEVQTGQKAGEEAPAPSRAPRKQRSDKGASKTDRQGRTKAAKAKK